MTPEDITHIEELLGQSLQPWQRRLLEYEPTARWLAIQKRELDPSAGILLLIIDRLLCEVMPLSSAREKARADAYATAGDEVESWSLGAEELRERLVQKGLEESRQKTRTMKGIEGHVKESGWLG